MSNPIIYHGSVAGLTTAQAEFVDDAGAPIGSAITLTESKPSVYEGTNAQVANELGATAGKYTIFFSEGGNFTVPGTLEWNGTTEVLAYLNEQNINSIKTTVESIQVGESPAGGVVLVSGFGDQLEFFAEDASTPMYYVHFYDDNQVTPQLVAAMLNTVGELSRKVYTAAAAQTASLPVGRYTVLVRTTNDSSVKPVSTNNFVWDGTRFHEASGQTETMHLQALKQFATDDTGETVAQPGSVAKLSQGAGGGGGTPVDADVVSDSRTWFARGRQAKNTVRINSGTGPTLSLQPDLNPETSIQDVSGATISGVSAVNLKKTKDQRRANFDPASVPAVGKHDVVVTVTTTDSQTIITTAVLEVF